MAYKRAFDDMFINGAIRIVADYGVENLRTKDVAELAGFSEATLFRAFATKEDLLRRSFLTIDKQISDMLTQSDFIQRPDDTPLEIAIYRIWHKVYCYLIEHREEALFMIRYRYSSYYTEETRNAREVYNGSFNLAYDLLEKKLGGPAENYRNFLFNYIFEMTLCFAEKVVTGRLESSEETERRIWNVISCAVKENSQSAENT